MISTVLKHGPPTASIRSLAIATSSEAPGHWWAIPTKIVSEERSFFESVAPKILGASDLRVE